MDGVHDLGGMEGFGPIPIEESEPIFHADWEARVMAMRLLMGFWRKWNIDVSRHSVERLPPQEYLSFSYYEKWLASLTNLMVGAGLVTIEEVAMGSASPDNQKLTPPIDAEGVRKFVPVGKPVEREIDAKPAYSVGDRVRTARQMHSDHHRLPRYVRNCIGEIILHHGAYVFPDSNARFAGEEPQHLYSVQFKARDLWGDEASPADVVVVDLWESYFAFDG